MRRGCKAARGGEGPRSVPAWRAGCARARAARALLSMNSARRRAAARNCIAALTVTLALHAAPVFADGANLILPLVSAIAFASAASNVTRQVATLDPGKRPLLSLLPKQVQIVDGYQYDFEDYVSGLSGRATWSTATASFPTISSASPAAAGRPSSPTTKSTAAPSPAAATSSASNSSTASERRARHLSAVEGHHLLSAIAELREALGACCSPSLPTPSPCPSSCYQRTGLFPPFAGYR